jgi:hypothetical protein
MVPVNYYGTVVEVGEGTSRRKKWVNTQVCSPQIRASLKLRGWIG